MDARALDLHVELEAPEEEAQGVQGGVRVGRLLVDADAVVLEVDHAPEERGRVVDAQEGGVVAEGEVVVDLVPVAEDLDAREGLLAVEELAGEPVGDHRDGVRDAEGLLGLEVDVGDLPDALQHPLAGRQDEVHGAVRAAPGLDQPESEPQPPLVQVALEAVERPDLPEGAGVLEALHEARQLRRELGRSALLLELGDDPRPERRGRGRGGSRTPRRGGRRSRRSPRRCGPSARAGARPSRA